MTLDSTLLILAWAAIFMLALAIAGIIRQLRILVALQPTNRGLALVPAAVLPMEQDVRLILLLDTGCRACEALLPAIDDVAKAIGNEPSAEFVLVFKGNAPPDLEGTNSFPNRSDIFAALRVNMTPYAIAESRTLGVLDDRLVGSELVLHELADLVVGAAKGIRETSPLNDGLHLSPDKKTDLGGEREASRFEVTT